jgi:hypothetical protein
MSYNPRTGGPAGNAGHALRKIAETLRDQNAIQRAKIAAGETPDYDPDEPLPDRRCRYGNYP